MIRNKSFIFALDKTHFPFFPAALRRPDSVNSWVSPNRPTHTIFDFMKNPTHDAAKDTIARQQDRLTCNGAGLFHETSARSVADVRFFLRHFPIEQTFKTKIPPSTESREGRDIRVRINHRSRRTRSCRVPLQASRASRAPSWTSWEVHRGNTRCPRALRVP